MKFVFLYCLIVGFLASDVKSSQELEPTDSLAVETEQSSIVATDDIISQDLGEDHAELATADLAEDGDGSAIPSAIESEYTEPADDVKQSELSPIGDVSNDDAGQGKIYKALPINVLADKSQTQSHLPKAERNYQKFVFPKDSVELDSQGAADNSGRYGAPVYQVSYVDERPSYSQGPIYNNQPGYGGGHGVGPVYGANFGYGNGQAYGGHNAGNYGNQCYDRVKYVTKYKVKTRQVPVYNTVVVPQYVTQTIYKTQVKLAVRTLHREVPNVNKVHQTNVLPQYAHLTRTNYHVSAVDVPYYVTETVYSKHVPTVTVDKIYWAKSVDTQIETAYVDEPVYVTKTAYDRVTKYNVIHKPVTVPAYKEHLVLKTVCNKGHYGGY